MNDKVFNVNTWVDNLLYSFCASYVDNVSFYSENLAQEYKISSSKRAKNIL